MSALDLELTIRILAAFALGAVIGFERESINQPAGLRTHMLVAAGSACFSLASIYGFASPFGGNTDVSRVAAQIVTGVGFLGAGAIWRTSSTVRGLTTAASIWMVAAVGILCGTGLFLLAVVSTVLATITLRFLRTPLKRRSLRSVGEPSIVGNANGSDELRDEGDDLPEPGQRRS